MNNSNISLVYGLTCKTFIVWFHDSLFASILFRREINSMNVSLC